MTKEQEILLAAEEEFFKKGYDAASTAVIAQSAGVTHAMVNYYYRSKRQLFVKVLENCLAELLDKIKLLMSADGDFVELASSSATVLFDSFLSRRRLPFLLLDLARTHPEFLSQYREAFAGSLETALKRHEAYLESQIDEGKVSDCTVADILDTVVTFAASPFLHLPMLENVLGLSENRIEDYLSSHRAEMVRIIRSRYSARHDRQAE